VTLRAVDCALPDVICYAGTVLSRLRGHYIADSMGKRIPVVAMTSS
jgi:hypothetical protein